MNKKFMYVGKFIVKQKNRDEFISVINNYENTVEQKGLDHSHLVEDESEENVFWYVTIWLSRTDWEAVKQLDEHKKMHEKRDPLLAQPANQNFGTVIA